jgi:hypothetical protein
MTQGIIYAYIDVTDLLGFLFQTLYSFLFSFTLLHSSTCLILHGLITHVSGEK